MMGSNFLENGETGELIRKQKEKEPGT